MVEHSLIQNNLILGEKGEKRPRADIFCSLDFFFCFTSLLFSKHCLKKVADQMFVNKEKWLT